MTDSITINTGVKRILINDDPAREIRFNPTDVQFAETFYSMIGDMENRLKDYQQRSEVLEQVNDVDDFGLPVNAGERIAFLRELCEYMHAQIDRLFGEGTALTVFQGALDLDAIQQFFTGITPFVEQARADKLKPYRKPDAKAAMK